MGSFQLYQTGTKMKGEKWRTSVEEIPGIAALQPMDTLFSMGSCFSDNLTVLLKERRMTITGNPFGIIYNPVAIQTLFRRVANAEYFSEKELFEYKGLYRSLETHSDCSDISVNGTLNILNTAIDTSRKVVSEASLVLLTFGTSLVYMHKERGVIVANNHALPANDFTQKQLSIEEVRKSLENIVSSIRAINPHVTIVYTLSPVRHFRNGLMANARSKAVLLEAIHQVVDRNAKCNYFPAYEYLMDELRDYRFYTDDLIHPSNLAVRFVWEKFIGTVMAPDTLEFIKDMEQLLAARNHRLLHPATAESRRFIESRLAAIDLMQQKYPFLHFDEEVQYFHSLSSS
ncbi:MAG TPA: GSCFA domain protein [Bacteroidetes bacterium]|jgi:hypothetical protein|nr:GSCFA domain protein [Bacteroidota bacterium]